jgi:hypothetical protein
MRSPVIEFSVWLDITRLLEGGASAAKKRSAGGMRRMHGTTKVTAGFHKK